MLPRFVDGGWQIGEFSWAENPRFTVPAWCTRLVHTWARLRRWRGGGGMVPGQPILPQGGGLVDQVALAMDAFEMFDLWADARASAGSGGHDQSGG